MLCAAQVARLAEEVCTDAKAEFVRKVLDSHAT